jgi:Holliday junction resolvase RusA-like endonuclease
LLTPKEQNAKFEQTTINQGKAKMEDNPRILPDQLDELPSYYWTNSSGGVMGVGFTVYQKPIPMPRPAATMTRNGLRVYSPKKTKGGAFSLEVKNLLLASMEMELPLFKDGDTEADLHVSITYRIRRPNDHFKSSNQLKQVKESKPHVRVTGGDLDNLVKFTLDSLNNVVYFDDKMITSLSSKKLWSDDPKSQGSTTVEVKKNLIF